MLPITYYAVNDMVWTAAPRLSKAFTTLFNAQTFSYDSLRYCPRAVLNGVTARLGPGDIEHDRLRRRLPGRMRF